MIHHPFQYTFYVGIRFGGHDFRGTVVSPRRLSLCELDSVFGLRSERADLVSQLLDICCVLSLEAGQFAREHIVCFVNPGIVSLPSTEQLVGKLTL